MYLFLNNIRFLCEQYSESGGNMKYIKDLKEKDLVKEIYLVKKVTDDGYEPN